MPLLTCSCFLLHRRAAERLLVGPAPAPCVLRLAGWLPLRVLRHLYTFVALLVGECFASPQDLSEDIEVRLQEGCCFSSLWVTCDFRGLRLQGLGRS